MYEVLNILVAYIFIGHMKKSLSKSASDSVKIQDFAIQDGKSQFSHGSMTEVPRTESTPVQITTMMSIIEYEIE